MKALLTIIILALIGWGVYAMMNNDEVEAPVLDNNQAENENNGAAGGIELATTEFTVRGKPLSFSPANIEVHKGDKVRINFVNESGTHDLVVEGYNVRTNILQGGQSEAIEFIADKAGTFEYYCSVGTHRQMGMKGTLTVREVE